MRLSKSFVGPSELQFKELNEVAQKRIELAGVLTLVLPSQFSKETLLEPVLFPFEE